AYMEKIANSKEAILLQQCLGVKSKRNDLFEWEINGGSVKILPCNGEKLRGIRANILILDEYKLLSADMVQNVLMPFLVAPSNIGERLRVREKEDELIRKGEMTESQRQIFDNTSRMIALSSASYTFENLYKTYSDWYEKIYSGEKDKKAKYFIQQVSWDSISKDFMEETVIEEAQSSDKTHPAYRREFCAEFCDGSESYFSALKMKNLTIENMEYPTVLIKGDTNKEYVLSIDPNYNDSPTSDHFSMSVLELNKENESATLIHTHAKAGAGLKEYVNYYFYLLSAFNIVMICFDNMDGGFINSANESVLFQDNKIKIGIIDYDSELQSEEYIQMLKKVRNQYNLQAKKICFRKVFNVSSIRRMAEELQTWINTKKIWFGSRLTQSPDYNSIIKSTIPYPFENKDAKTVSQFIYDLISDQDDGVQLTKDEAALIEVRSNPSGGQIFDLPQMLKRNTSPGRARKDSFTSLLLGVECAKAYYDIMRQAPKEPPKTFIPFMAGKSTM
ncbi:MAG: hypothetical protein AABY22_18660, partial [Nanoarchaeota archaeon]